MTSKDCINFSWPTRAQISLQADLSPCWSRKQLPLLPLGAGSDLLNFILFYNVCWKLWMPHYQNNTMSKCLGWSVSIHNVQVQCHFKKLKKHNRLVPLENDMTNKIPNYETNVYPQIFCFSIPLYKCITTVKESVLGRQLSKKWLTLNARRTVDLSSDSEGIASKEIWRWHCQDMVQTLVPTTGD